VLADVEGIDSDALGENRFLDGVANHLVARDRRPRLVDRHRQECVEPELEALGHL
jgi:hypothetical protein